MSSKGNHSDNEDCVAWGVSLLSNASWYDKLTDGFDWIAKKTRGEWTLSSWLLGRSKAARLPDIVKTCEVFVGSISLVAYDDKFPLPAAGQPYNDGYSLVHHNRLFAILPNPNKADEMGPNSTHGLALRYFGEAVQWDEDDESEFWEQYNHSKQNQPQPRALPGLLSLSSSDSSKGSSLEPCRLMEGIQVQQPLYENWEAQHGGVLTSEFDIRNHDSPNSSVSGSSMFNSHIPFKYAFTPPQKNTADDNRKPPAAFTLHQESSEEEISERSPPIKRRRIGTPPTSSTKSGKTRSGHLFRYI